MGSHRMLAVESLVTMRAWEDVLGWVHWFVGCLCRDGAKVGLVHCRLPFNVFGEAGVARHITGKRVQSTL